MIDKSLNILGVSRSSSRDEVKQAYRDLVKVWHPDRFVGDDRLRDIAEKKTKEINEAYARLEDYFECAPTKNVTDNSTYKEYGEKIHKRKNAARTVERRSRSYTESARLSAKRISHRIRRYSSRLRKKARKVPWYLWPGYIFVGIVHLSWRLLSMAIFCMATIQMLVPLVLIFLLFYGKVLILGDANYKNVSTFVNKIRYYSSQLAGALESAKDVVD